MEKEELIKFLAFIYKNWEDIDRLYPDIDTVVDSYLNNKKLNDIEK